jgi:hypothetical protein
VPSSNSPVTAQASGAVAGAHQQLASDEDTEEEEEDEDGDAFEMDDEEDAKRMAQMQKMRGGQPGSNRRMSLAPVHGDQMQDNHNTGKHSRTQAMSHGHRAVHHPRCSHTQPHRPVDRNTMQADLKVRDEHRTFVSLGRGVAM